MLKNASITALQNRPWLYKHEHDGANPGRIVEFDPSGKINGYNGEQEARWLIEDGVLWFVNVHGNRSIRFHTSYRSLGRLVIEGEFVHPGFNGLQVRLDEGQGVERISSIDAQNFASKTSRAFEERWVPYSPTTYGDTSLDGEGYMAPPFDLMQLPDVQFASRFGALIKDRLLVSETSFQHPFFLCPRITEDKHGAYLYQTVGSTSSIEKALYVCGGMYSNFYHWLMFLMAKIRPEFIGDNRTVVVSEPKTEFQKAGLSALLAAYGLEAIYLQDNASLAVEDLAFPHQRDTTGVDPHPCIADTFARLKRSLVPSFSPLQKIYVSRSDTNERRLINERAIEEMLAAQGFTIVSLTGKTLREQISLFHNATDIIGAHGAGLTNVGFAKPGTRVLEFQNPTHVNWCMKKIAAISGCNYGYLMGHQIGQEKDFELPESAVANAVEQMRSLSMRSA
jgi:hypothetical protein